MIDLASILSNAQNGAAFENMARQYGLSREQSEKVVEAFLPAFTTAFKRKAAEPAALPDLMTLMTSDAYRQAFETAQAAFTPQAQAAGTQALAALFGSKDVSRAIADQMATYSGVGPAVLKSMLPALTSLAMGGMGNALTSPSQDTNPLMAMMTAMGNQTGLGGLVSNALAGVAPQVMTDMMRQAGLATIDKSGAALREAVGEASNPAGPDTPLGDLLGAYVQGYNRGRPAPAPEPPPEPEAFDPAKLMGDLFSQMLTAGKSAQGDHASAVEQIFDRLMTPKR